MGERRGRVKSRNTYKGPMDKDNGVGRGFNVRGRARESNGGWEMGTIVTEQ